jgi:hypothetical protein
MGGKPAKAIEELQPAVRYEFAINGLSNFIFSGAMYPAYVRGEALLADHKGAEAAAEFEKIIDKSEGLRWRTPWARWPIFDSAEHGCWPEIRRC